MIQVLFDNTMMLVIIIFLWSMLACALFLLFTFTFIIFTVMGEDYQHKKYRRDMNRKGNENGQ